MRAGQSWLYDFVQRVPEITDEQIAEMRHIEPVLRHEGCMFCRVENIRDVDPRNVSFLWHAKPCGEPFTFDVLNRSEIITQHHSAVFFKPSLAEVYAWIRVYLRENWRQVRFFCMGEPSRVGASSDIMCRVTIMGGPMLKEGPAFVTATGTTGYTLVEVPE